MLMSEDRDRGGRFVKGGKPGPGRPLGARNKLGEAFLQALQHDFEQHGATAIAECREKKPDKYVAICASLLPKEVDMALAVDIESRVDLQSFVADYRMIREALERIGAEPILLEATDD
jgi:hypothetical protein